MENEQIVWDGIKLKNQGHARLAINTVHNFEEAADLSTKILAMKQKGYLTDTDLYHLGLVMGERLKTLEVKKQ